VQALFPYYGVTSLTQEAEQLQAASGVLTGFYLALSSVGLTVGLLFLALVLLRRVEADRRSIGIRRALGIPGGSIAGEILRDGATLAILGSAIGVLVGYLIVEGLATWAPSAVGEAARLAVFTPVLLGEIVAGVVGLSFLASAVATRTALRLPIAEALR
jgi:putative ABC transport system permease protein